MAIFKTLLLLLVVVAARCNASESDATLFSNDLEKISSKYESGYCKTSTQHFSTTQVRQLKHLTLQDILVFATDGEESITKNWIGNLRVFKIGRTLNPSFIALTEYAKRSDISAQISEDIDSIAEEYKKQDQDYIDILASVPFVKSEIQRIKLKTKAPLSELSEKDATAEIISLVLRPMNCLIYEAVFIEHSEGGRLVAEYLQTISKEAAGRNMQNLRNSLQYLESTQ